MKVKRFKKNVFVDAREARGLSQVALAEMVGCSETDIYRYEAGVSYPRKRRLGKLVDILGVTILDESEGDNPLSAVGQFTEEEERFRQFFEALPYPRKCMMLGSLWATTAYGKSVNADYAAQLSGHLAAELQQQQENSGQHEA